MITTGTYVDGTIGYTATEEADLDQLRDVDWSIPHLLTVPARLFRALRGWSIRSLRPGDPDESLSLSERNEIFASLPYLEEIHDNDLDGLDHQTLARLRLIRTSGCAFLKGISLPRMTYMEIYYPTMPSFEGFDMPNIEVLHLRTQRGLAISTKGLEAYNLRHLFVQDVREFADLSGIRRCKALELDYCRRLDLDSFVDGVSIGTVILRNCGPIPSLRWLSRIRDLEDVSICGSTVVQDGDLSALGAIPRLYVEGRKHYSHRVNRKGLLVPRA